MAIKSAWEGFRSVITSEILDDTDATANNFYQIALGGEGKNNDFNIREIFKIAMDSEIEDWSMLEEIFWHTVDNFDNERKRNFVKFITGIDKLPYQKSKCCE